MSVVAQAPVELRIAGVTPVGLRLKPGMVFDEWLALGGQITAWSNASSWALGDWLFYGEWEYGSRYEKAAELTGFTRQALADLKYVAGRFELSRRRDKLTLSHHREVAPKTTEEQDRWLDLAEASGWSVMTLRAEIIGEREGVEVTSGSSTVKVLPPVQLTIDDELAQFALRVQREKKSGLMLVSEGLARDMAEEWSEPVQVRLHELSPGLWRLEARRTDAVQVRS